MSIPTYDQLLRPILELAAQQPITRGAATKAVSDYFKLTEEQRAETIPSGASTIGNRAGWAMSHLHKGALIEKVAKYTYAATQKGRDFLKSHSGPITPNDLRNIEGFEEAWAEGSRRRAQKKAGESPEEPDEEVNRTSTPEEQIDHAMESLGAKLRTELLEQLLTVEPYRFEKVVLDLLFAMGYGGSREEAAQVTRKSNDEGIDGIINEDRLGLDVIYVQAKRWKGDVGRVEVQNFVGALAGKHATKGIFITTSRFNSNAKEYARMVAQKVILIDGQRLADLMIEHNVGVSTIRTVSLKRMDTDYFEEG